MRVTRGLPSATIDVQGLPIYAYGNSYAVLSAGWYTAGKHWLNYLAGEVNASATVTSYGVGGQRILHGLYSLINETSNSGTVAPVAGAKWPGTSSRTGLVALAYIGNDIGHYPSMTPAQVVPAVITTADTKYLDGLRGMYRAALALISSETRLEQTESATVVYSGTWTQKAFALTYLSGGTFAYTTTVGAAVVFNAVTPPQTGPLAGKVYVLIVKHSANAIPALMATINVQVDGGTAVAVPVTPWERYTGTGSVAIDTIWDCIPVTLPVDGAAHSVKLTHAGSATQRMDVDCIIVPSATPNWIVVPGAEQGAVVHAGVFDAAGVAAFAANIPSVTGVVAGVCGEFPNAVYSPSRVSSNGNGTYSGDGLHPNDRGMPQLAAGAAEDLRAAMRARVLKVTADGSFAVI